jgi:hypothetical protein
MWITRKNKYKAKTDLRETEMHFFFVNDRCSFGVDEAGYTRDCTTGKHRAGYFSEGLARH